MDVLEEEGQALMEAQRYPEDFDGFSPVLLPSTGRGLQPWACTWPRAVSDPNHLNQTLLGREDLERLYEGIMEQVDAQDGLKDRIIEIPAMWFSIWPKCLV